ncbi:Fic/DOC family protein [Vibrio cincinnatiensis]|uniref:Fic/DOC family protein n=1 Tax=Vibrio cincinnatiensis TaxID=675 RepID=UPI001EDE3966|nr:Fic family protein [Vibrio cincinnatiensis]MCG3728765.1 cell filamentation protein Fic [Vibrio cincinnatiensis]
MRDKYGTKHDKYCYPDTELLVNLLNIQDADRFAEAEAEFTAYRYRHYQSSVRSLVDFHFAHYKYLHYYLFQDLYAWAGQIREVDIAKGSTRFCTVNRIEPEAEKIFSKIPLLNHVSDREVLIEAIADLFCDINLLHPFREGNGRVERFFFEEMVFILGYELTWPSITQQQWIEANIAGVHANLVPLQAIFSQALSVPA